MEEPKTIHIHIKEIENYIAKAEKIADLMNEAKILSEELASAKFEIETT